MDIWGDGQGQELLPTSMELPSERIFSGPDTMYDGQEDK